MSGQAINWAFEAKCPSPEAKLALLCLADVVGYDGLCWPHSAIVKRCQMSPKIFNEKLAELERAGLLVAAHDGCYRLLMMGERQ